LILSKNKFIIYKTITKVGGRTTKKNQIKNAKKFVESKSVFMQTRGLTFNREIKEAVRNLTASNKFSRAQAMGFYFVQIAQAGVDLPAWVGAYHHGLELFDADETKAVDYADMIVRTTQGSGSIKDIARVQAENPLLTMFYTFQSVTNNMITDGAYYVKQGRASGKTFKQLSPKLAAYALFGLTGQAVIESALRGQGPDDDDNVFAWLFMQTFLKGAGSVVGLRDALSYYQFGSYDYSPVTRSGEDLLKATTIIWKEVTDPNHEMSAKEVASLVRGFGTPFGVSGSYQLANIIKSIGDDE
jgi:hypothetical protein